MSMEMKPDELHNCEFLMKFMDQGAAQLWASNEVHGSRS
jgi:hypothetical protein